MTLGNRTFKHAKPTDFNDTEDLTINSIFPDETEAALVKLSREFTNVILDHIHDTPTCGSPIREQIALLQHIYRTNPSAVVLVKTEYEREGYEATYDVEHMRARALAFIAEINEFMQGYRIFCVTTHRSSEKMWSNYGGNHTGIVLRIEPNLAKDSKFQLFRPVIYHDKRPSLYDSTLEFIGQSLFGDQMNVRKTMLDKIVYAKTLEWKHENEYRLAIPLRPNEEPWDTLPYHPEEITELYLGVAMEICDIDEITRLALAINPNIAIYRGRWGGKGAIEYSRAQ